MNASIDSAIEDISQYIGWSQMHNDFFLAEAKAINSYILYYQKLEKHRAIEMLNQELDNNSLLTKYLHVHLLQHNKLTEEAICYFDNHFTKADYDKFPYLHSMKGQCYLRQLNEKAEKEFHFFVNKHKGQHYIKEAYQKLAWFQFSVKSDTNQYFKMLDKVLDQAEAQMDGDIQAENEAKARKLPNQNLLKARILFDGAYYSEAQHHLDKYESTHESNIASLYLRARIYQESGRMEKAIQIFKLLVEQHSSSQDYRITNSALQLGIIHEKLSENFIAKEYYELCLQMKPQDYRRSMRQKAHSGLERLEKW
jgi:Tfp pilus assembly protein PilF